MRHQPMRGMAHKSLAGDCDEHDNDLHSGAESITVRSYPQDEVPQTPATPLSVESLMSLHTFILDRPSQSYWGRRRSRVMKTLERHERSVMRKNKPKRRGRESAAGSIRVPLQRQTRQNQVRESVAGSARVRQTKMRQSLELQ